MTAHSDNRLSIRVMMECKPSVTPEQARQIARTVAAYAEDRTGVSQVYEVDVYSLEDEDDS